MFEKCFPSQRRRCNLTNVKTVGSHSRNGGSTRGNVVRDNSSCHDPLITKGCDGNPPQQRLGLVPLRRECLRRCGDAPFGLVGNGCGNLLVHDGEVILFKRNRRSPFWSLMPVRDA